MTEPNVQESKRTIQRARAHRAHIRWVLRDSAERAEKYKRVLRRAGLLKARRRW